MDLTSTHLRYLLTMYQLSKSGQEMRLTEIANILHVKKASAARIVSVFRDKELAEQQPYGKVRLTELGKHTAEQYEHCVHLVAQWLMYGGMPLEEREAYDAACLLLPELPDHCIRQVKKEVQFCEKVIDN